ncbi:MAG: lamin tail domain-containing protein [Pyrinomonadaceae bacterium]
MLSLRLIALFFLVLTASFFSAKPTNSTAALRRVTNTGEEVINLNPSLSGDGRYVGFESTANLAVIGGGSGFRAVRADLASSPAAFAQMGISRAVAPAASQDGSRIAFASHEDLLGTNADRNSEIFLFNGLGLKQITNTTPGDIRSRTRDGNFQPSITDDGRFIAFSSNRNIAGANGDLNFEIFLFDSHSDSFLQLTDSQANIGATDAKISGDGSRVAFLGRTDQAQGNSCDLLLYNRAIGTTVTLNANRTSLTMTYGRAISDNGSRVVYADEIEPNHSEVFLFDAESNSTRQITSLGVRADDVPLHPTISGDGKRIAFATRRNVVEGNSDRSVELYVYDIPTGQFTKLTSAPASATEEVVSSLNDDGSLAAFNFPRVLSGPVSSNDLANNSEIYVAPIDSRPAFGTLVVQNDASRSNVTTPENTIAPDSIAIAQGNGLARSTEQARPSSSGSFPLSAAGTTISVNGHTATILYVSPTRVTFVVPAETEIGPAEVVVTNSEGFQSRTSVAIRPSAPGLFTSSADGRGEGVVLDADTLLAGPFDPTGGQLRVIVFATGVRGASQLSSAALGHPLTAESIQRSPSLPGLDEIHLLVPSELRGAGAVTLTVTADNQVSNAIGVTFVGSFQRDILINEFLADPANGVDGDANHDGVRDSSDDEFVELVNTTARDLDISAFQLQTRSPGGPDIVRHTFASGTILAAGTAMVVFGGGHARPTDSAFGGAQVFPSSTGGLSLLNGGAVITLRDSTGSIISFLAYGGSTGLRGDVNQSLTRSPDVTGNFDVHQLANGSGGRLFSPGTQVNGVAFQPQPAISQILVSPAAAVINAGEELRFTATALDQNNQALSGVIFGWQSRDASLAVVDANGLTRAIAPGTAQITASGRGVRSAPAILSILAPLPSPSPSPSASPSPTPTSTPTPVASPAPSPAPSPSSSPSPSPNPRPLIVIGEFRTRGPNGANDEFVEIYNSSDDAVDIAGWKIRGSSNSGTISTRMTINPGTILPARGHFLATNSGGYSGPVPGDQAYASGITNDGGVALTLPDDAIVDQVGMSLGSAFKEGMHLAPLPSDANQSYERRPGGAAGGIQDSNDNFGDFQMLTPSDPQNLSSNPTPEPTPAPSPSPAASPSPSPSPTPSATPSVSPTPSSSPSPSPAPSPSPSPLERILISQIYGGGGNSGSLFRNDFIEIFNAGETAVNLAGWSVQYAGATSASWSATVLSPVSLAPGQYYLIQESSGGNNGAVLPAPDATGTIAMAATAGKVALVNGSTALIGTCPTDASIVDLVGYGSTANCFRVRPTAAPGNATSVSRKSNGCTDTSDNANDFTVGTPNPRNMMAAISPCGAMASLIVFANSSKRWCELRAMNDLPRVSICRAGQANDQQLLPLSVRSEER